MSSVRHTLIVLDPEVTTLREIEDMLAPTFNVLATRSADRATTLIRGNSSVAAIIVEYNLGSSNGLTVLQEAQALRPALRRVLIADPAHLAEIIEGLRSGVVERVIYKPVSIQELNAALAMPDASAYRATA